ncbi:hypothetical protein PACTADRAFT_51896 [Pachysolen tannophilus NRRL Y-2460]|uniref:Dolichyl-diphosphooligosaccharide--protein glycosyltransferase subunit 1 n=1 Tax=Pachysolen tannophilus NRRL Y-2460 TaxID=669874 RepID=A0A1E4TNF3_PACTA|nr:hypothetical protein PACTADRAFT_51896 [Pachysolen tannophilus NRRL Y-2460]
MMKVVFHISVLLTFVFSLVCSESIVAESTWENVELSRNIDLARSYVKESVNIQIQNVASQPESYYYFPIPEEASEDLALFLPTIEKKGRQMALIVEPVEDDFNLKNLKFFRITMPFPIAPKATIKFAVSLIYNNQIKPLPEKVEMDDKQSLVFQTNKLPLSIYPTKTYDLKFTGFQGAANELRLPQVPASVFEKYASHVVDNKIIEYGPFDLSNEPLLEQIPMAILYDRVHPLMYIDNLERGYWVSHWASTIQVEENYELTNKGAALKNGFSRVDYMKKRLGTKLNPTINSIDIPIMDDETTEIYYTDLVGNVSTSSVIGSNLLLRPRFPIFGGWHYNFTIGFTNPLSNYLVDLGNDEFILKVPLFNGPIDCGYNKLQFKAYLPSGSQILNVSSSIVFEDYNVEQFYSYLDITEGHTEVSMNFTNLVDEMRNTQVIIKYRLTKYDLFKKALSISFFIFIALISFIGVGMVDIRINTDTLKKSK